MTYPYVMWTKEKLSV